MIDSGGHAAGQLPPPIDGARQVRTVRAPRGVLSSTRTKARRAALDLLFEADQRSLNLGDLLAERVEVPVTQAPLREYTVAIVRGVLTHWSEIDDALATYSRGWSLDRMPAVDRAILRVAAWEILHNSDVPAGVAISEAIEIAGVISTDDSPGFINGLLSRVADVAATAAAAPQAPEPDPDTIDPDTIDPDTIDSDTIDSDTMDSGTIDSGTIDTVDSPSSPGRPTP